MEYVKKSSFEENIFEKTFQKAQTNELSNTISVKNSNNKKNKLLNSSNTNNSMRHGKTRGISNTS